MRRRILLSVLAVVILTTVALGLPLMVTAWLWMEHNTRDNLQVRLQRIAAEVAVQQRVDGTIVGALNTAYIRPLIPDGAQLTVRYPVPGNSTAELLLGPATVKQPIVETLDLSPTGQVRLDAEAYGLRQVQERAVAGVALIVLASMTAGIAVAIVTARRLADPLADVAARAARLGLGDFRPVSKRYGIPELDRVSDVLDHATEEIAVRLQREHALVADVSHQLRSRLTAIRLRLDELSVHHDPAVVIEAEEAMAQVDRLTDAIDELIRSSRADASTGRTMVAVLDDLTGVVGEWQPAFASAGRRLKLIGDRELRAPVTEARLRESVSVLIDNALAHGQGEVTVRVWSTPGFGQGDRIVRVDVSDEGKGVDNELAAHIFDRGFSGAGSTGVGLALARALIEADGGRLELQRRSPPVFAIFLGADDPTYAPPPNPPTPPR